MDTHVERDVQLNFYCKILIKFEQQFNDVKD